MPTPPQSIINGLLQFMKEGLPFFLTLDSHSRSGTTEQSKSPAGNPKGKLAGDFLFVGWPHSALTIILTTMQGDSIPRILTGEKLGQTYLWASDRFFFTM